MTYIFGPLDVANLENVSADPATFNSPGRAIWNTTSQKAKVYDGAQWKDLGGAGGGAGANWSDQTGDAPVEDFADTGEKTWLYESGLTQNLVLFLKVPAAYAPGTQINCLIGLYSPSAANTILLESTTYLIQKDTDAVTSTTNSHASTNSALTNTVADQFREATLDLSDAAGEVNSVAIAAGDLLRIVLVRGTDTDTADIRFIPSATEPTFT